MLLQLMLLLALLANFLAGGININFPPRANEVTLGTGRRHCEDSVAIDVRVDYCTIAS